MTDREKENTKDMLSRLKLIATGERDCDLSDNDAEALAWILNSHRRLLTVAANVVSICDSGDQNLAELACMETSPLVGIAREALAYAVTGGNQAATEVSTAPSASAAQKD